MAKNKALELTIKISGKVDKSLTTAISQATGQVSGIATTFSRIGTVGLAAMGALATGSVAAIANCTNEAVKYQDALGDVIKYVDGLADAQGRIGKDAVGTAYNGKSFAENYDTVYDAILNVATVVPMAKEDLAELTALMGQSGKTIEQMFSFDEKGNVTGGLIRDAGIMAAAWDIGAKEAADYGAKWENSFRMTHEEVMELANQINYLGANSATTAAEIAGAVNQAASLGQLTGIDPSTVAALADAMLATGVSSDRVGTSIKRMALNLSKGEDMTKKQKAVLDEMGLSAQWVAKSLQEDSVGTLNTLFEGIRNLPKERQLNAVGQLFGIWAAEGGAKIVNNLDVYSKALEMVADQQAYMNSMQREFDIKTATPEAIRQMRDSAIEMFKVNVGKDFVPVRAQMDEAIRQLFLRLNDNLPQLQQLSGTLADLASKGIEKVGDVLEKALPYIQQALDYVNNNGPKVAETIGKIAAVLVGMKFAPAIEGLLGGVGSLLFGKQTGGGIGSLLGLGGSGGGRTGGLFNAIGNLFSGGQRAGAAAGGFLSAFGGASSGNGFLRTAGTALSSLLSGNGLAGTTGLLQAAAGTPGLISGYQGPGSVIANAVGGSGIGQWFGGIGSSLGNFFSTGIGGGLLKGAKGTASVTGEILKGISDATGLTGLVQGIGNAGKGAASWIGGKATGAISAIAGSRPIQAIGGFASNVISSAPVQGIGSMLKAAGGGLLNTASAGAGVLGSVWGPIASGFGSLFAGAAPVIGVISGIIAVMSILGDHMEDIRGIIGNVFGKKGLAVFDFFAEKISGVKDFIMGLFEPGAMTELFAPLQESITNLFGENAGAAFGGIVTILESILGIVGQIVTFATTVVKHIIEEVFHFIVDTVLPILLQTFATAAPAIAGIIDGLGTAIMTAMTFIGEALQTVLPIIEAIVTAILNVASVVIPIILDAINAFVAQLAPIIEGIKGVFDGLIQFITGVFSGNWEQAWEGVKQIFSSAFDALAGLLKAPINAVISIINGVINNINGLGITIPDWVPFIGGQSFTVNIPTIPMLARGGFTNGPSIAGEAGQEAVISFLPGVRAANIATWLQAGRMLGMDRLLNIGGNYRGLDDIDPSDGWPGGGGGGTFTFAPQITIQGNADRATIDAALEEAEARFQRWWEQMQRRQFRTAY